MSIESSNLRIHQVSFTENKHCLQLKGRSGTTNYIFHSLADLRTQLSGDSQQSALVYEVGSRLEERISYLMQESAKWDAWRPNCVWRLFVRCVYWVFGWDGEVDIGRKLEMLNNLSDSDPLAGGLVDDGVDILDVDEASSVDADSHLQERDVESSSDTDSVSDQELELEVNERIASDEEVVQDERGSVGDLVVDSSQSDREQPQRIEPESEPVNSLLHGDGDGVVVDDEIVEQAEVQQVEVVQEVEEVEQVPEFRPVDTAMFQEDVGLVMCTHEDLSSLDFSSFQHLTALYILDCIGVNNLLAHLPPALTRLHVNPAKGSTSINKEALADLPESLYYLNLKGCDLSEVDLGTLPEGLRYLTFEGCDLREVDLDTLPEGLQSLTFEGCDLREVDLDTLPESLYTLTFKGCDLSEVDLGTLPEGLPYLTFDGCDLSEVDLGTLPESLDILTFNGCDSKSQYGVTLTGLSLGIQLRCGEDQKLDRIDWNTLSQKMKYAPILPENFDNSKITRSRVPDRWKDTLGLEEE